MENYTSKYYLSGYLYNHQILKLGWGNNNYQLPRIKVDRNKTPGRLIEIAEISSPVKKEERRFSGWRHFNIFLNYL
ncbi:MAG: hypothetical protein F6K40_35520 [Okeania sp. SIO3I5]|nr:hypothetical protein [Okeania sp. SIO3I5]